MTPPPVGSSLADSPWTWVAVFLLGAVIALMLSQSKFQHRQAQLERQFFARQQSGHTVPMEHHSFTDGETATLVRLEPLVWLLSCFVFCASGWFWWTRWSNRRRRREPDRRKAEDIA